MEQHHMEAVEKFLDIYKKDKTILAILLGGSIAHGFETYGSDIDLLLIVNTDEYKKREQDNKLTFSIWDICNYENGYIDCKIADLYLLNRVAADGSDPARYAFKDNRILYSGIENLEEILLLITRYPVEKKEERRLRFASQLLAWKWYYSEGFKKQNEYLIHLAVQKLILFSARLILNENELLYPYHKWMLRVLETAESRPENILIRINNLLEKSSVDSVNSYVKLIFDFIGYTENEIDWPNYFIKDSELNWLDHEAPVDDL
jgi:predicted nucleotidyltransferase